MVLHQLNSTREGLTEEEAAERLKKQTSNLQPRKKVSTLLLLLQQFTNPLILILIGAAILSYFLGDKTNSIIILIIVFLSGIIGFWQEKGAFSSLEKLLKLVRVTTKVVRGGKESEVEVANVVPGDIVLLRAGDIIPADGMIIESKDLFVDESQLTGESFPVEKTMNNSHSRCCA